MYFKVRLDLSMNEYYGKALSREEMSNLRNDAEETASSLYNSMIDYISALEARVRNLERKNRELRGQVGKQLG